MFIVFSSRPVAMPPPVSMDTKQGGHCREVHLCQGLCRIGVEDLEK
jgi:hypothetical protein